MLLSGDTPQAFEDLAFEKTNPFLSVFSRCWPFWVKFDLSGSFRFLQFGSCLISGPFRFFIVALAVRLVSPRLSAEHGTKHGTRHP